MQIKRQNYLMLTNNLQPRKCQIISQQFYPLLNQISKIMYLLKTVYTSNQTYYEQDISTQLRSQLILVKLMLSETISVSC